MAHRRSWLTESVVVSYDKVRQVPVFCLFRSVGFVIPRLSGSQLGPKGSHSQVKLIYQTRHTD